MHAEILAFLRQARVDAGVPVSLHGLFVVELGSYNLNGSPREVFAGAAIYIGVDWRPGPGVDVVSLAHEAPLYQADIVVCCQVLEHDPYWVATVKKACGLVKKGGWLFLTWAGPGYEPHELATAPVLFQQNYYQNHTTEEVALVVRHILPGAVVHTEYRRGTLDALLWAQVPSVRVVAVDWVPVDEVPT